MRCLWVLAVSATLVACGGQPSAEQMAWCGENIDAVHRAFVEDVYGGEVLTRPANETEVGQRMKAYFTNPPEPPDGMTDDEQSIVDRACRTAYAQRLIGPVEGWTAGDLAMVMAGV